MLETIGHAGGLYPAYKKGETYDAEPAANQPDFEAMKLYFIIQPDRKGCELLVSLVNDPVELVEPEFEIVDHGFEHSQYFQGCGVAYTNYRHVATGVGSTPLEALDDATDQIGWDHDAATELIAAIEASDEYCLAKESDATVEKHLGGEVPEDNEIYYYVSIRYNL